MKSKTDAHWTHESEDDMLFNVAHNFMDTIERKRLAIPMSHKQLAKAIGVTEGRISQLFNNPGNLTLKTAIKIANALKIHVLLMAYDQGVANWETNGPIHPDIFNICWKAQKQPKDFHTAMKIQRKGRKKSK